MTDPNSAKPTIRPTVAATEKARLPNSRSGSTGSAARRSTAMKATSAARELTTSPIAVGDVHA